jgi:hypothetical protein
MNDPVLAPERSIYIDAPLFYVEANGVEIAAAEGPVVCASFCTANRVTRWKYAHRETVLEPSVCSAQMSERQKKIKIKSLLKSGNGCNSVRNFVLIRFMFAFRLINLSGK